ncbi:RagB/SusD family nutrient uptake outer membrane protein [uncultured Arcticibacterium sp.]|uniref:RagB/SusD family nutrient uptake outer membrane protein n=1 Tax=uncultured Arcticibacterium sp. TaxID=2173042 RepID=UPI0030F4B41A
MKKIIAITGLLSLFTAMSCNDEILDKINPNGVTFETYFNNEAELTAGVNSIYALVQSNSLVSREWFFTHDLKADEVATGGGQLETPRNQILIGVANSGNSLCNAVWTGWYRTIHRANVVIEKGPSIESVPAETKARLIGEAQFLRAWAYYELGTLFGGAPIYTEFSKTVDGANSRASQSEVYNQAIADAKAAEAGLAVSYSGADLGRATKAAAQTLLARIYLQMGNYASAKTELKKIVDSGQFSLVSNYLDLTNEEGEFNPESIFEIVFSDSGGAYNWGGDSNGNTQEETVRTQEYSAVGWRNLIPSNKILNAYERTSKGDAKSDPRYDMSYWKDGDLFNNGADVISSDIVQGNSSIVDGVEQKVSWRKYSVLYKSNAGYATSAINQRIMRYADVLLMLAECEAEDGNLAAAVALVNQVRARESVDMPPLPTANYPTSTQAEVLAAIQHERYVELAGEQVRDFDLVRWRKNGKLTEEPLSYFVSGKHEFLPIPQGEIDNNPNLTQADQNPGY